MQYLTSEERESYPDLDKLLNLSKSYQEITGFGVRELGGYRVTGFIRLGLG